MFLEPTRRTGLLRCWKLRTTCIYRLVTPFLGLPLETQRVFMQLCANCATWLETVRNFMNGASDINDHVKLYGRTAKTVTVEVIFEFIFCRSLFRAPRNRGMQKRIKNLCRHNQCLNHFSETVFSPLRYFLWTALALVVEILSAKTLFVLNGSGLVVFSVVTTLF